jgi:hypothetical protein
MQGGPLEQAFGIPTSSLRRVPQLSEAHLQSLVDGARAVPGLKFETLAQKQTRGALANPHRVVELVERAERMIQTLKRGEQWVEVDGDFGVAAMELGRLLSRYEYAKSLPGFDEVGVAFATTQDYSHALTMLDAAWFLDAAGNAHIEFIPTQRGVATTDLRIYTSDRSWSWQVEIHVPSELVHPLVGTLTATRAREIVGETLRKKKAQLRTGDSFLMIGGLGCDDQTVAALKRGATDVLSVGRRSHVAGVLVYSMIVVKEDYRRPDGRVGARLHNGARADAVENPGYAGPVRLSSILPPDAPLRHVDRR